MRSSHQLKLCSGLILIVLLLLGNHRAQAATTPYQSVKVQNRQLLVDFDRDGNYSPFIIKGAAYSPTPIGRYSDDWGYPSPADPRPKNLYDDPAVLNRDFKFLKTMNANVVRFWKGNNTQVTFADTQNPKSPWYLHYADITRFPNYLTTQTFDLAQTYGLKIIAGFEMAWPGGWQCNAGTPQYGQAINYADPYVRSEIISRFRTYVLAFKDHPALLFWAIGNENNLGFNDQTAQGKAQIKAYYSLTQEMAQEARLIEGPFYHPVAIVNGDLGSIGQAQFGSTDAELSNIDIWGANVYRGATFGNLFQDFTALSNKAFWISEFGEDAWQVNDVKNPENGREDQTIQATIGGALWKEIKSAALNQKSIGATIMAYSDEWWKPYAWQCEIDNDPLTTANGPGGCNLVQNYFGFGPQDQSCPQDGIIDSTPPAADHFFNEEWWGIMSITKDSRPGYPDVMTPRQIYTTLQQLFLDDLTLPVVSMISPENNSAVIGNTITISATATDNVGVVGVQFKLDGNNLGAEDLIAPYSMVWDTTSATDGLHTLTAVARDADGNLGTASATITVSNNTPPASPTITSAVTGDAKVVLNWNNTAAPLGYTVKYGTTAGSYPNSIDFGSAKTATITGLINGTTYYFTVVARYNGGSSQLSNEMSATLPAPDFVITTLNSPATIKIGNTITVNNTVTNSGAVSGATFITAYYLSFDDQITPSDILLGTRTIPNLNAGASSSAASVFTVPSNLAPATYYLGAIADYTSFRIEQNENNNTFLGNSVSIAPGADLIVTAITGPINSLPGSTITLTDTVKNQGTASIGASYMSYYLSPDPTITSDDVRLGNRFVPGLAAGATSNGNVNFTIPATLPIGTYYWGAIADFTKSQSEADEDNNATTGNSILLTTSADLTMTAVNGPANAAIGQTVNITDTVKNQGTMSIGASFVGYYLSTDPIITSDDIRVGVRYVPNLTPGATSNGNVNVAIPAGLNGGTYYWGVIADYTQSQGEADESNNTKSGNTIVISAGTDLTMTAINGPANATTGQSVTITATVKNQGSATIGASYVGYYLSSDATISNDDIRIGSRYITGLAAGALSSGSVNVTIPATVLKGTYYLGVIADFTQSQTEADENNNAKAGNTITITPGADLTITAVAGPASSDKGKSITLTDTVKNQGVSAIGASFVGYYLSTDSVITTGDLRLGVRYVPSLAAGANHSGSVNVTVPASLTNGTYYVGAIADYTQSQGEADENNNTKTGNTINITSGSIIIGIKTN
jgi:subtilase family serine protease